MQGGPLSLPRRRRYSCSRNSPAEVSSTGLDVANAVIPLDTQDESPRLPDWNGTNNTGRLPMEASMRNRPVQTHPPVGPGW